MVDFRDVMALRSKIRANGLLEYTGETRNIAVENIGLLMYVHLCLV